MMIGSLVTRHSGKFVFFILFIGFCGNIESQLGGRYKKPETVFGHLEKL